MRKAVAFVLALVCPALAQAQTFSQRCSNGDSASSACSVTTFATLTAPAFVVVTVRVPNTTDTVTGITGCGSGWARAFSRVSATERNETWYATNLGAIACTPAVTWSGSDPGARMSGLAFTGVSTTTPLDVTSVNSGSSTAFSSGATATLAQAVNLAVGTCANNSYQTTFTGLGAYTLGYPPTSTDVNRILMAYRVTSATTAETFAATGDQSVNWSCGVAIFKAPSAGVTPRNLTLLGVGENAQP